MDGYKNIRHQRSEGVLHHCGFNLAEGLGPRIDFVDVVVHLLPVVAPVSVDVHVVLVFAQALFAVLHPYAADWICVDDHLYLPVLQEVVCETRVVLASRIAESPQCLQAGLGRDHFAGVLALEQEGLLGLVLAAVYS